MSQYIQLLLEFDMYSPDQRELRGVILDNQRVHQALKLIKQIDRREADSNQRASKRAEFQTKSKSSNQKQTVRV